MMTDEMWVDITPICSNYEIQLEVYSGKTRFRPIKLGPRALFEERGIGEWTPGPPPGSNLSEG